MEVCCWVGLGSRTLTLYKYHDGRMEYRYAVRNPFNLGGGGIYRGTWSTSPGSLILEDIDANTIDRPENREILIRQHHGAVILIEPYDVPHIKASGVAQWNTFRRVKLPGVANVEKIE